MTRCPAHRPVARGLAALAFAASLAALPGCAHAVRVPLGPFYDHVELDPRVEVRLGVPYRTDAAADPDKHRLDLFLPPGTGWPLFAFVHGGSLEKGHTGKTLVGNDIYRNIGRFFAAHGAGVALINYRLQPEVEWPAQVDDVATATAWLLGRAPELGGDGRVYLSGHSAGAWLASRTALDDAARARHGIGADDLAGVISVSGSGFDLTDEATWEMFGRRKRWRRRFSVGGHDPDWARRASVVPLIDAGDETPFLLLYSTHEWRALAHQNRLFCDALHAAGHHCELEAIDGLGHRRMVLALSREEHSPARRVLREMGLSAGGAVTGSVASD